MKVTTRGILSRSTNQSTQSTPNGSAIHCCHRVARLIRSISSSTLAVSSEIVAASTTSSTTETASDVSKRRAMSGRWQFARRNGNRVHGQRILIRGILQARLDCLQFILKVSSGPLSPLLRLDDVVEVLTRVITTPIVDQTQIRADRWTVS